MWGQKRFLSKNLSVIEDHDGQRLLVEAKTPLALVQPADSADWGHNLSRPCPTVVQGGRSGSGKRSDVGEVSSAFAPSATYNLRMTAPSSSIEIRLNRSSQPRAYISGTRIRVIDVYALAELQGLSPDEIVMAFPHLTLAQVHAALAYYFDHRTEIIQQLREEKEIGRQFRAMTGPGPLEARLAGGDVARDPIPS